MEKPAGEKDDIMLAEYSAAQEMLRHYDTLNWQIGSILIAAITVLTGLMLRTDVVELLQHRNHLSYLIVFGIPSFSFGILGVWNLWFERHRDLYNLRNETMHRIELKLGMYHHLRAAQAGLERDTKKNDKPLTTLKAAREKLGYDDSFVPLYPDLSLGGPSGKILARFILFFIPAFQLLLLRIMFLSSSCGV